MKITDSLLEADFSFVRIYRMSTKICTYTHFRL